jgi:hypothetical protein
MNQSNVDLGYWFSWLFGLPLDVGGQPFMVPDAIGRRLAKRFGWKHRAPIPRPAPGASLTSDTPMEDPRLAQRIAFYMECAGRYLSALESASGLSPSESPSVVAPGSPDPSGPSDSPRARGGDVTASPDSPSARQAPGGWGAESPAAPPVPPPPPIVHDYFPDHAEQLPGRRRPQREAIKSNPDGWVSSRSANNRS